MRIFIKTDVDKVVTHDGLARWHLSSWPRSSCFHNLVLSWEQSRRTVAASDIRETYNRKGLVEQHSRKHYAGTNPVHGILSGCVVRTRRSTKEEGEKAVEYAPRDSALSGPVKNMFRGRTLMEMVGVATHDSTSASVQSKSSRVLDDRRKCWRPV